MAAKDRNRAGTYDLLREYQAVRDTDSTTATGGAGQHPGRHTFKHIDVSPAWAIAVVRLGRPLTYSRATQQSVGDVKEGAFVRNEEPLIITDDCVQVQVQRSKGTHVKRLNATLKNSGTNYLNRDVLLPGDWMFAWMTNNEDDMADVLKRIRQGAAVNEFYDGLKFVGRVHDVRKRVSVNPQSGHHSVTYSVTGIGFEEMDSQFFYDMNLATASAVKSQIRQFMAQLGLEFSKWTNKEQLRAGNLKDNAARLIETLVDIILGSGVDSKVNRPLERAAKAATDVFGGSTINNMGTTVDAGDLKISPQANKEAPFAYLVPLAVGRFLGVDESMKSKGGVFGYADLLQRLIGVQHYDANRSDFSLFVPESLDKLKGTFLPVNPSFVNRPLWQMLHQYLNPAINEMYTALRPDKDGRVQPTLVVRQIPFSTEAVVASNEMPLTRFMELPRWLIDPVMVTDVDIGRSNATRTNMVHIYGEASTFASNKSITHQLVRNPPIFDTVDIQRSGIRGQMKTVNCAVQDQLKAPRAWMEAIADWSFGSQYTLNGTIQCVGIQSPIAEGDNIEFEGVAYHIETVTDTCTISPDGHKSFHTSLQVSNGMPVDQEGATSHFPRYPGFRTEVQVQERTIEGVDVSNLSDEQFKQFKVVPEESDGSPLGSVTFDQEEFVDVGDDFGADSEMGITSDRRKR